MGLTWSIVLLPQHVGKEWFFVPLAGALLAPAVAAAVAAGSRRGVTAGTRAALLSGLVGGLLVFVLWVSAAFAGDGRPYDPGLVRDYQQSGAHSLAAYAVSDDLGGALVMLVLIPTVALALGSISCRLPGRPRR